MIGTLFGTGGPFYVIYLHYRGMDKTVFRATIAVIFLLDGAARIVGYAFSDFYNSDTLLLTLLSLPVMAIALYIGGYLHTNISQQTFKRAIAVTLLGSGIALLLR